VIAGLGEGIIEGLGTPFVQALHKKEPGRYINVAHAFWSVGVFVVVLGSGALLALGADWRLVVGGSALIAALAALFVLAPARPGHEYPETNEGEPWKKTLGHAWLICRIPRFWLFFAAMFLAGGGEFCLTFWSASHIQLAFGSSAWMGGAGTALFAAGMALGRLGFGYLVPQRNFKQLIFLAALAGVAATLPLPFAGSLWLFLILLFLSGVATAPYWPSLQSLCADRLPHTDTTMLFILLSCAGVPGCGFFTWLTGILGNLTGGLAMAFLLVPACYLGLAVLSGIDWLSAPAGENAADADSGVEKRLPAE
jgi:fucose permease